MSNSSKGKADRKIKLPGSPRLTEQVKKRIIYALTYSAISQTAIAQRFGLHQHTIAVINKEHNIRRYITWSKWWVGEEYFDLDWE